MPQTFSFRMALFSRNSPGRHLHKGGIIYCPGFHFHVDHLEHLETGFPCQSCLDCRTRILTDNKGFASAPSESKNNRLPLIRQTFEVSKPEIQTSQKGHPSSGDATGISPKKRISQKENRGPPTHASISNGDQSVSGHCPSNLPNGRESRFFIHAGGNQSCTIKRVSRPINALGIDHAGNIVFGHGKQRDLLQPGRLGIGISCLSLAGASSCCACQLRSSSSYLTIRVRARFAFDSLLALIWLSHAA